MTTRNYEFEPWNDDGTLGQGVETEIVFRFSDGSEASVRDLERHTARQTLHRLAKQHQARKSCSYSEAFQAVAKICPGEMKAYLGV